MITPGPFAGLSACQLCHPLDITTSQLSAVLERASELVRRAEDALAEHRALRRAFTEALRDRRGIAARQELLGRSLHAQMAARLQTMPVIEQAKGIIMAQSRCGAAEAFDALRRASQRSNVPVRELAAQLVANTARVTIEGQSPAPARLPADSGRS